MIAYKLVTPDDHTSLIVEPPYSRTYIPGFRTYSKPGTHGLMAFESIECALDFFHDNPIETALLMLVRIDPDDVILVDYISLCQYSSALDHYYDRLHNTSKLAKARNPYTLCPIPMGTICCKKLHVIREVMTLIKGDKNHD